MDILSKLKRPYLIYLESEYSNIEVIRAGDGIKLKISPRIHNIKNLLKWYELAHNIDGVESFDFERQGKFLVLPYLGIRLEWLIEEEKYSCSSDGIILIKRALEDTVKQFAAVIARGKGLFHGDASTYNIIVGREKTCIVDPAFPEIVESDAGDDLACFFTSVQLVQSKRFVRRHLEDITKFLFTKVNEALAQESIAYRYALEPEDSGRYSLKKVVS